MSAEVLREAAAKLRESAEAATPGPWRVCESPEWHEDDLPDQVICADEHTNVAILADEWYEDEDGEPASADDAAYIALVHPAVGLALADWLDSHAGDLASANGHLPSCDSPGDVQHALAVAEALLGGAR